MNINSLIVCVSHDYGMKNLSKDNTIPDIGAIYTVRAIEYVNGEAAIKLHEIINPIRSYSNGEVECSFRIKNFREIQPPMDIDIESLIEETATV